MSEKTPKSIRRISHSPYQKKEHLQYEKKSFEDLGLNYLDFDDNSQAADFWISNTHFDFSLKNMAKIPKHLSEEFTNLKLIIHPNSGHDNFRTELMTSSSSPMVILGNPIRANAVAQWYLSELFYHIQSLSSHQLEWSKERTWNRELLSDNEILIIGNGHIGKLLHQSLRHLVKNIHIYDPHCKNTEKIDLIKTLKEHRPKIVLVCPSLNETSKYLIDKNFLDLLVPDFVLLNASRGPIINQQDLCIKLEKNLTAKVSLDVFETEPQNFDELLKFNRDGQTTRVRTFSHIAGVYKDLSKGISDYTKQVIQDSLNMSDKAFKSKYSELILQNRCIEVDQKKIFV